MAGLDNVRNALRAWALTQGEEVTGRPFEIYKNGIDPAFTAEGEYEVYWNLKSARLPDDVDRHAASHGAACCYPACSHPACCYPACCVSGGCVIDSPSTAAFPGPGAAPRPLAFAGAVLAPATPAA